MPDPSPTNQTLSFLQRRFAAAGLKPNARHGQHFLIDLNLLRLLFKTAQVGSRDVVLEVGTGTGALTAMLADAAAAVVGVEIDRDLFRLAREQLGDRPNVTLLNVDALRNKNQMNPEVMAAVRERLQAGEDRQFKLVANLPYNVATPIITNLLSGEPIPRSMTVTIQKEVADRLRARPGTKDHGSLSIWVQSQCRVKVVRSLPPTSFWPRPKVMSAIVQMVFRPSWRERLGDPDSFQVFVRAMFMHRRKLLRSQILATCRGKLDKAVVDTILVRLNLPADVRAEQLDVEQFVRLFHALRATCGVN
jgi:16S rRNA (adenine1518-N6/adenine1519-N6)-dimethyltransferase